MRVLVTGCNRGIGLGVCTAYAERGDHVIAACRNSSPELDALGVQVVDGVELTSDAAVARLRAAVGEEPLDVLVCNAAVSVDPADRDEIDLGILAHSYEVNVIGSVRTVLALLPSLREGAKIMLVMCRDPLIISRPPHAGNYGYFMSKAALAAFGHGIGHDLHERGIAVLMAAPGVVDTDMVRRALAEDRLAEHSEIADITTVGRLFRDRIDELTLADSPAWHSGPRGEAPIPLR